MDLGGRTLTIEAGKIAKQANGAVLVRYGDTAVVVAVTSTKNALNTDAAASSKVIAPDVTQDNKAVFYSYANSWIDKNKNPKVEEPIDVSKQTYILLKAKFNNKDYFYKVPVNKRLYESNDEATADGKPNWRIPFASALRHSPTSPSSSARRSPSSASTRCWKRQSHPCRQSAHPAPSNHHLPSSPGFPQPS